MKDGTFRLYRLYPSMAGGQRLVARFTVNGQALQVLEDHDGIMKELAPAGAFNSRTLVRLKSMAESPYWRLAHEEDIQQGFHDDLVPEAE